ncbi:DNA sulfur modification protein DndD [Bacillus toyonensis]|uniref:DNA sulfur modification protein DndD n=1 Tax=Bacillus toyonensis TaxID=155322 RepID=UPI0001A06F0C|nr:DNA sulfur modification protein DndD [Bacillus toyonensis]EEL22917.1 ATPase involved in DNA repair [Bacillus cereus Rock1-3]KAB2405547.1 DNA sulfur modification protein DndD [Bacillus toyonensis]PEL70532.1 DNA sulfur modification protein DndD [Bacillus toyonensis]PHE44126.1 DNA sulfur modification protein DndD [Bacillus toyonensis]HDR7537280.1 DNA sulfur modification protein DndD [Bacillus toyonensis]
MKFNKLTLSNIGAYYGNNEFVLTTSPPHQNVVLFGGKNGAGKTTLLNAIKFGLFGPLMLGYRTENEDYKKKILSFLNRKAISNKESFYQIKLDFTKIENYEKSNYEMIRRWELKNNNLKEQLQILKNKQYLNEQDKDIFLSKLREEMPPHVIDLCFFDGEDISRIVLEDRLAEYIEHSSKVLFNLDLFEHLERDLSQLVNQEFKDSNSAKINNQLLELHEVLQKEQNQKDFIYSHVEQIENEIERAKANIEQARSDFEIYGGLFQKERDRYTLRINEIEHIRKKNTEEIKLFIATLLPFYLNRHLLSQVQQQMEYEQANETYEHVNQMLKKVNLKSVSEELKPFIGTEEKNNLVITNVVITELMKQIKPNSKKIIHRASFKQRSEVENMMNRINNVDIKTYLSLFKENQSLLAESKKLRDQLAINDKTNDFKNILDSIENYSNQLEKLKQQKDKKTEDIIELTKHIEKIEIDIKQKRKQINDHQKHNSVNKISNKLIKISEQFRALQRQKKLQQVQYEATTMMNKLLRKKEYLSTIKIDSSSFNVSLYNKNGAELNKDTLSAGERQILLISIIWAMLKTSGRRLPLVFDTLLGRLDQAHKESLLTHFIPVCSEQVIILSTDSEIDSKHYSMIKDNLATQYTIEYNMFEEKVDIQKNYFEFNVQETYK